MAVSREDILQAISGMSVMDVFELSKSIDEVRSVYENLNETDMQTGQYPFESLKTIYKIIESLGYGELNSKDLQIEREKIRNNWKQIRQTFLAEFDRSEPTVFDVITQNELGAKN